MTRCEATRDALTATSTQRVDRLASAIGSRGRAPFEVFTIMLINGACHCKAVSFTAQIDPSRVMVCHCTDCQVLSGSPFRAVVAAPIGQFTVQGPTKSYVKVAQSGNRRAQVFCPECGTPLYATAPENATSVVIRLGCVEQRSQLKPSVQIWQHSAMPWLSELPSVPGSPAQQSFMPAPDRSPAQ